MATSWHQLFNHYYPRNGLLSAMVDVTICEDEIKMFFGNRTPNNDELCEAVRWLASPEFKGKYAPGLKEIIMAVCIGRKKKKLDTGEPEKSCEICFSGWIDFFVDYKSTWDLDDFSNHSAVNIPCLCDAGRKIMDRTKTYKDCDDPDIYKMEAIAKKAIAQQAHRNKLVADLYDSGVSVSTVFSEMKKASKTIMKNISDDKDIICCDENLPF